MSSSHNTAPNALHPSIIPLLDQEYIDFHNTYIRDQPTLPYPIPLDLLKYMREGSLPGSAELLEVGSTEDLDVDSSIGEERKIKVQVLTPKGDRPESGWPVLIWFHGGGWVMGSINIDVSKLTRFVNAAGCVVVTVEYRLAPENPFPAAIEDAVSILKWVSSEGPAKILIDPSRIAVGGSSSGANISAVLALKASSLSLPYPLKFQLITLPATNLTLNISNSACYAEKQHVPGVPATAMDFFVKSYVSNATDEDLKNWEVSPIFAPADLTKHVPKTWIGISEVDILMQDGIDFGEKLRKEGSKEVEVVVYKGVPHMTMHWDGVLESAKKIVKDACDALARGLETA